MKRAGGQEPKKWHKHLFKGIRLRDGEKDVARKDAHTERAKWVDCVLLLLNNEVERKRGMDCISGTEEVGG